MQCNNLVTISHKIERGLLILFVIIYNVEKRSTLLRTGQSSRSRVDFLLPECLGKPLVVMVSAMSSMRGIPALWGIAALWRISTLRRIAALRRIATLWGITALRRIASLTSLTVSATTHWGLSSDIFEIKRLIRTAVELPRSYFCTFVSAVIKNIDNTVLVKAVSDVLVVSHPLLVRVSGLKISHDESIVFNIQAEIGCLGADCPG